MSDMLDDAIKARIKADPDFRDDFIRHLMVQIEREQDTLKQADERIKTLRQMIGKVERYDA